MKKRYLSLFLALLMAFGVLFTSCGEEKNVPQTEEEETSAEISDTESVSTQKEEEKAEVPQEPKNLVDYVEMTFGTGNYSLCTIGPTRPNASVCPGPDTYPASYSTGYKPDSPIRGFSQIHGNCGEPKYGNFLISPQIGLNTALDSHDSGKKNENPTATEYNVTLTKYGIDVSLTPTEHSVLYKFTYPSSSEASLVIDMAHYLHLHSYTPKDISVEICEDDAGNTVICGKGAYDSPTYYLYFYGVINKAAKEIGTYECADRYREVGTLELETVSEELAAMGCGAYMTFDTAEGEEIYLKMGVSFHSIEKAKEYLDDEIPAWDYDAIIAESTEIWQKELGKIEISGEGLGIIDKKLFYTCLYNCHKMPRDRTGDIAKFGDMDMIDDHIATWDTFRSLYPLYMITNPDFVAKTVNSYIARLEINGSVRDLMNGGNERKRNQGGDNVDNIIVEAYLKGIEGVDWNAAYEVIKENAEYWRDDQNTWSPVRSIDSTYRSLGYIPGDGDKNIMCCSKTLEYAYNDYLAAQMALGLGDTENYEKWLARSENWKNIWNSELEAAGYKGYIWPRAEDGSWIEPNDNLKSPTMLIGSWKPYFYEGTSYEYSFFVPHDVETLIEYMGGEESFADRLSDGIDNGWVRIGNQPGFLCAYLFNHTSEPYRTSEYVAKLLKNYSLAGTPGCEDSGALCSWYVFSNIGFFPGAGQDFYYLTSPKIEKTVFKLDSGKTFTVKAEGLSDVNKYIQSVTLNGKPLKSTIIKHSDIIEGGELIFTMGSAKVNYAE